MIRIDTCKCSDRQLTQVGCDCGAEAAEVARYQAMDGPGRNDTWMGKRTPKGLVIRQVCQGQALGQWFVPMTRLGELGEPLRMPWGGGPFQQCMGPAEAERVLFFARREAQA